MVRAIFWSRIMISRGFEAVHTVFGGYFGFGKKTRSLRERDVVKHGPYTAPHSYTMVSKGLRLDLGTKVYRTVHFVHTGYAVDSTQSRNTSLVSSYNKNETKMYYCSAS